MTNPFEGVDRTEWPQDQRDVRRCILCDTYHVHEPPHPYDIRLSGVVSARCSHCGEDTCQTSNLGEGVENVLSDDILEEVGYYGD